MNPKVKELLLNWKILMLVVFVVCSFIIIRPTFDSEGVAVRSVKADSSAYAAGMVGPSPKDKPMMREIITAVNGIPVENAEHFLELTSELGIGEMVRIDTFSHYEQTSTGRAYSFFKKPQSYTLTVLPDIARVVNTTTNQSSEIVTVQPLGISVYDAPSSNLKKGLDLEGGTRVILQPDHELSPEDMSTVVESLKQRLNVYGLGDLVVRSASDLEGAQYIVVEIAGANEEEVKDLLGRQGKFEAKIGNETVFSGGEDITFVCRSAECSFASDPRRPCSGSAEGYFCTFSFSITLSNAAAKRQSAITNTLFVIEENGYQYLNESLDLYLDDELVDTLRIGADLKGRPVTDIAISGPGVGRSYEEALQNSAQNMKRLQTILITGSLPVKLNIVKIDTISPVLGAEFITNIWYMSFFIVLAVALVIFIRFRRAIICVPVVITMLAEIILLLGLAALIGWNIDLAAIAGILIAVGTGVDDQIVIIDEVTRRSKSAQTMSWKDRVKHAFFIIMAAYFTTCVAMLPLLWAGAGLLKGFAITTILGVTIGVFITRPAFAAFIEVALKEEKKEE